MSNLPATDVAAVEAALQSYPDLAAGLGPLLRGECGIPARDLVLGCLVKRLDRGVSLRAALIPALAEALRIAGGDADLCWRSGGRL